MNTFEWPEKKLKIIAPENVNELSEKEYQYYVLLVLALMSGQINENQLKMNLTSYIIGYSRQSHDQASFENQIFANQMLIYLSGYFTFSDFSENFILGLRHNPIHHLKIGFFKKFKTFQFDVRNNYIKTDLTAKWFVDLHTTYTIFSGNTDEKYLNWFTAVACNHKSYTDVNFDESERIFSKVSYAQKMALYFAFAEMLNYLFNHSNYSSLFTRGDSKDDDKMTIGLSNTIYSLSKRGYGMVESIEKMPLTQYLDIMLKEQIDNIAMMKDSGMSLIDIAKKTKLTPELISQMV